FNARTEVFEDLEKAGVIDPTKVERTALQNAASVASLLLTTEAMIADRPKKKAKAGGRAQAGCRTTAATTWTTRPARRGTCVSHGAPGALPGAPFFAQTRRAAFRGPAG